jgi:hypothetical protein
VLQARLKKPATTDTLCHTCTTELMKAGVNLLVIQKILMHGSLSTTAIYMHVRRDQSQTLDLLPLARLCANPPPACWYSAPRLTQMIVPALELLLQDTTSRRPKRTTGRRRFRWGRSKTVHLEVRRISTAA